MKKDAASAMKAAMRKAFRILDFVSPFLRNFAIIANINRVVSLLLITALLAPVFLFNPVWSTAAQKALMPSPSAPVSAPPQPYVFPAEESNIIGDFTATLKSAKESISEFFTAPQLPEGFEMAKPVSPFASFTSSMDVFLSFNAKKSETTLEPVSMPLPAGTVAFDFDADGKADYSRWRKSDGSWSVKKSSDNSTVTYTLGSSSSTIVPADYDNDGKTDYAVFNPSTGAWTIRKSSTNTDQTLSGFGQADDKPVVGDYDGDSKADPAVWRPSNGTWYVAQSSSSYTVVSTQFGQSGDIPVAGDYDGDGALDKAVYRPTGGYWYVLGTTSGFTAAQWGLSSDIPVPADYDGDNKTDYTVYRGSTGTWYAYKSSGTGQYISQTWGNYGDQPVPADYDGDSQADFAVWRPKTGNWYVYKSCNYNGTCSQGNFYKYGQLGANGDVPAEASYLKQISSLVQGYELNAARLSPKNSTGGTDLYSRNFSWGTSLVGLPGRAGLNAGFGMSYNSLVWTKQGSHVYFDTDSSNISPGFRFGFPVIEPAYYDDDKDVFSYLMVTPSGDRVEFRQLSGASDTYETADSSYVQLKTVGATNPNDPAENITITVTGTDGTKMSYEWKAGVFRCKKITDRNGNYIEINHDEYGLLRTVTDTLGRVITVYYDGELYPTAIKQTWKDNNGEGSNVTRTWATFTYTTQEITTNFSLPTGGSIYGPPNGTVLKVLQKVTFPTDSSLSGPHTTFEYNTWGQVKQINNYAADSHKLNHVRVDLPADATGAAESDCPRFTETKSYVENFNGGNEITITNSIPASASYNTPAASGTATLIEVSMTGHPHGGVSKTYVGSSGWQEGLPIVTEDWANGANGTERKRWTWTNWTQDNTNLSYILNPRVSESRVGDPNNVKKAETDYYPISQNSTVALYGLVKEVRVYDSNLSTVLKKAVSEYNLDTAYTSRRIIGLPSKVEAYGMNQSSNQLELSSKTTFAYDEGNFNDSGLEQNISSVIQHDNTNYGSSFIAGRGNLTSTTRWNVEYPTSSSYAVTSSVKYNIAGAPVAQISPWNGTNTRQIKISYADSFNDTTTTRNTYAYPTKLYDSAGNYSEVKYRFDIGANVWAKSPDLSSNTSGKVTGRIFDAFGRLQKESVFKGNQAYLNNQAHAYTRFEYPTNNVQSKIYATVNDTDNDGADTDDEVLSESWTDGSGRFLKSRTPMTYTNGSVSVWSGTLTEYDVLGRVKRSSVPTEINSNWTPTGADSTRGWLWTYKKYDWKGRVTRIINTDGTDGTTLNDSDQLINYEGCGCAGGEIITTEGESVPVPGQSNPARRKQKIYSDILGRQYKTEIYNWDGTTVYSATVNTYNGRDQIAQTKQYAGAENSNNTNQVVTMTYDGHGRMKTRHYPIEDSQAETSWIYNADDSIQQVIDPRGSITNFTYNNRGLAEEISYTPPANYPPANSPAYMNIPDTPTVKFTYDAVGNRITMEDGLGPANLPGVTYQYNELSQIVAENRYFADNLPSAPLDANNNQTYRIEYTYNLSGALKSLKDPFGAQFDYTHDKIGRLTDVNGTSFGDNTTGEYLTDIKYRAWGGIKQLTYKTDDDAQVSMQYDNRLRVSQYQVASSIAMNGYLKKSAFTYNADSSPQAMDDQVNTEFDRSFAYDHVGRLTANYFGDGPSYAVPYWQTLQYDAFSQITNRATSHWGNGNAFVASYVNGRKQPSGNQEPVYDAAGNMVNSGTRTNDAYEATTYDAANRAREYTTRFKRLTGRHVYKTYETSVEQFYDGDGRPLKSTTQEGVMNQTPDYEVSARHVWSSVLGNTLTEVGETGAKWKTKVFAGGAVIAEHVGTTVEWIHADPVTGSSTKVQQSGSTQYMEYERKELEPLGQEILPFEPPTDLPSGVSAGSLKSADEPEWLCSLPENQDYQKMPVNCKIAALEAGKAGFSDLHPTRYNVMKISIGMDSPTKSPKIPFESAPTNKPSDNFGLADAYHPKASTPSKDGSSDDEDVIYGPPTGKAGGASVTIKDKGESIIDTTDTGGTSAAVLNNFPQNRILRNFTQQEWDALSMAKALAATALKVDACSAAVRKGVTQTTLPLWGDPGNLLEDIYGRATASFRAFSPGASYIFSTRAEKENYDNNRAMERDVTPSYTAFAAAGRAEHKNGYIRFGDAFFNNGQIAGNLTYPKNMAVPTNLLNNNDLTRALILLHELRHIITGDYSGNHDEVFNSEIYYACFQNAK